MWVEDYFLDRELFYVDKMMVEDLKSGETYQDMPKTRVIAFMDFVLRDDNSDIVQPIKFMYTKEPVRLASDKIRIYNVELPKFTAEYDSIEDVSGDTEKENALLQWLYMLTHGYKSEEEMEMLVIRAAGMEKFASLYHKANADQKLRDRYEYLMSVKLDENSRLRAADDRGKDTQARETAKNLYNMGINIDQIVQAVNCPIEVITQWLSLTAPQD